MTVGTVFNNFCSSIKLLEDAQWNSRIKEITKKINSKYYENEHDDKNHRLLVGSIGRWTATNDASDYDVLFNLPWDVYHRFNSYKENGQSALLQEVRNCIQARYPTTKISGDGQVVDVNFSDGLIEVLPAFENEDGSFQYPDSNGGGKWKKTNPRPEKNKCTEDDKNSSGTFRDITRMIRVWKNHQGIVLKGLLIDSFVDDYYEDHEEQVENASYSDYPQVMKDVFEMLSKKEPGQHYWFALGSYQQIGNDDDSAFIDKAQEALDALENIDLKNEEDVLDTFSDLFGSKFSDICETNNNAENEQFASRFFSSIDIQGTFQIKCEVTQDGFTPHTIDYFLQKFNFIFKKKRLMFEVTNLSLPDKFKDVKLKYYWKIRNYGMEAEKTGQLRGQIIKGDKKHSESTLYKGMHHYVECYVVVNNIVIARNRLTVPIGENINAR